MVEFRGVAKVGDFISIEACMEIMDLLYEKEDMSFLFRSPHSLAASILVYSLHNFKIPSNISYKAYKLLLLQNFNILLQVVSYVITVPKQKWEFPVLAWGKRVHLGSNTFLLAVLAFYQLCNTTI